MCWGCWSSSENASMRRARSAFPFLATPRGRNWRTVSVLNPDDLIAQAAKLIRPPPKGPPLQVDLRRAISAAYYGVFHATMIAAADTLIGRVHRVSPHYALVYRSVDHRVFKTFCELVRRSPLPVKYQPVLASRGVQRRHSGLRCCSIGIAGFAARGGLRSAPSLSHVRCHFGTQRCSCGPGALAYCATRATHGLSDVVAVSAPLSPTRAYLGDGPWCDCTAAPSPSPLVRLDLSRVAGEVSVTPPSPLAAPRSPPRRSQARPGSRRYARPLRAWRCARSTACG